MVARPETLPVDAAAEAAAATRALFEQHGRMVLSICRSLLRGAPEAEDAAQETFLAAHRSLLAGRGPRKPGAWLATIARNECLSRLRNKQVVVEYSEADGAPVEFDGDGLQHAVVEELKQAIAQLPPRQRQSVILREFYGLSPREVAAAMNLTTPVVDALLLRARRKLRRQLATLRSSAPVALGLPQALREALERAIPGFEASAGVAVGGTAGAGVAVKVAAAAIGVAAVGSVGQQLHEPAVVPAERPDPVVASVTTARAPATVVVKRAPVVAVERSQRSRAADESDRRGGHSGPGRGGAASVTQREDRESGGGESGGESGSSGSGSSGSGSSASASSGSGSSGSGSSGSGGSLDSTGSTSSGSSGSGESELSSSSSGSGSGESELSSSSSGSGSSGSGTSDSSGPGSGEQPLDETALEPSSD